MNDLVFSDGTCRGCGGFRYGGHVCPAGATPPPPEADRLKARWDAAERAFDRVREWPSPERALAAGLLRDEQRRINSRMDELESSPDA